MAWIDYTSGGGTAGTARLAAFEAAYPNAVVFVSGNDVSHCAINYKAGGRYVKIDAVEHIRVTEYRGLTLETAQYLKDNVAGDGKIMLKFTYTDEDLNQYKLDLPGLIGTERQCAISRANEAGGHVLTVTESTTSWSSTASGNYVSYGGSGTGSATMGDVTIKYGVWE